MSELPAVALSVRQPWAWAIIHGGKDIENRSWRRDNPGMRFRGRFCVHASIGMTRDEYEDAVETMALIGVECPPPAQLVRGGIIGTALLSDIVEESGSSWFFGPKGLVLCEPKTVTFVGVGGQLGFFRWWQDGPRPPPAPPAKWMLTYGEDEPQRPIRREIFGPPRLESPLDCAKRKAGAA